MKLPRRPSLPARGANPAPSDARPLAPPGAPERPHSALDTGEVPVSPVHPSSFQQPPRRPLDGLRPEDVRRANLRFVAEALEAAGVPYVRTRGQLVTRSHVAVPREQISAALEALVSAAQGTPMHVVVLREQATGKTPFVVLADVPVPDPDPASIEVLRVFCFHGEDGRSLVYGRDYACDVEMWSVPDGMEGWREGPRPNLVSTLVHDDEMVPEPVVDGDRAYPVARGFLRTTIEDITFPIDAVYLWVDGSDPTWVEKMLAHRPHADAHGARPERFRDFEELRYSLRSLDMYAPWIRTIHLVTDGQVPSYLRFDDRLRLVDHRDIADPDYLPMFNSDAIVTWLSRVPGLSEHFLYINDDCFFGRDVTPSLFFQPSGLVNVFPSTNLRPLGPVVPGEPVPQAKAKLTRRRIEERYGRTLTHIVRHTPHAMTRSLMALLEDEFADEVEITRRNRFRSDDDLPLDQAAHYVSQLRGLGVAWPISYGYVNVALEEDVEAFAQIVRKRDRDVFCMNDAPVAGHEEPDPARVRALLEDCFPIPSRWEK